MTELKLLCPQCNFCLIHEETDLSCQNCGRRWGIEDGVAKLSRSPSYWGLLPAEEMRVFLEAVRTNGWKNAIQTSPNRKIKELYLFTDCPSRADGTLYLSLTPESRVLDLGSGWGSYTFALSPKVAQIVAADSSLESLSFISLRAQQEPRKNIAAIQIEPLDQGKLPFTDRTFDAVIMNGVLEWVGSYLETGDPLKLQANCLKETLRVLKPAGEIWIGIENRFGLRYLLGAPDDHLKYYTDTGLAYTTLVPRAVANLMTQKRLNRPYRTYTHSLWGYQRLLRRAGYHEIEFYYPEPDYRDIAAKIYPLNSRELKDKLKQKLERRPWLRCFSFLGLETALCDSYFILARRK